MARKIVNDDNGNVCMNLACMKYFYCAMYVYNILNSHMFVYVDDRCWGNAVSRALKPKLVSVYAKTALNINVLSIY